MNLPLPRFFGGSLGLFLFHRGLSWPHLAPEFYGNTFLSVIVGILSDVWVSWLLTLVYLPLLSLLKVSFPFKKIGKGAEFLCLFILLLGLSAHLAYVGYFKSQILPFHLSYILEWVFLKSQLRSLLESEVILFFVVGLIWIQGVSFLVKDRPVRLKSLFLVSILILGIHVLHIKYKIQWFVHENLQSNVIENLAVKYAREPFVESLTESELSSLSAFYGVTFHHGGFKDSTPSTRDQETSSIKAAWDLSLAEGKKPLFLFVLMEGQREVDRKEFQPFLSELGEEGILFESMISTGTVTRGGQEAILCGYPGSVMSSTMRNHTEIKLKCLPSLTKESSFWIHGGMGLFDAQKVFWEAQGMKRRFSQEDFSDALPMTPWGISDLSLMILAEQKIHQIIKESNQYSLGMILTMSNHVPWVLPTDAPASLKSSSIPLESPAFLTAKYADLALKQLVEGLKFRGFWDQTILVVVGDHGHESPTTGNWSREDKLTRVVGLISGGLVEKSGKPKVVSTSVSQKDLAFFAASVLGLELNAPLSQSPFAPRRLPVFSDLGEALYFPLVQKTVKIKDIQKKGSRLDPEELFTAWYYKLVQEWSLNLGIPDNREVLP